MVATGVFISQAAASNYIGSVTSDDRGLAVGLYSTCYYAGGSLGGALPALFWTTGGWAACVALVVVVQLATMMLALNFWTHRGEAGMSDARDRDVILAVDHSRGPLFVRRSSSAYCAVCRRQTSTTVREMQTRRRRSINIWTLMAKSEAKNAAAYC